MAQATYLVFGDLHGRILPAFRLALAWQREHEKVDALLQVGDLGYFPHPDDMDKATRAHAKDDPLELGARLVEYRSAEADALDAEPDLPRPMWFTQGNHEDHQLLAKRIHGSGCTRDDFPVDYYGLCRCIRDGQVVRNLPGELRVAALWGIDDEAPSARRRTPEAACLKRRSANQLLANPFDVLLTHESPRDAVRVDSGSEAISAVIRQQTPAFAFFGHYKGVGRRVDWPGPTEVYHLAGLEFGGRGGTAEEGTVGVLRWQDGKGTFEYLDPAWLRTVTRYNWEHR